jgi:hypothetical protein
MNIKIQEIVDRANKELGSKSCRNTIPYCHWLEEKLIQAEALKSESISDVMPSACNYYLPGKDTSMKCNNCNQPKFMH